MTAKTEAELYADRNALALAFAAAVERLHTRFRAQGHPAAMDWRTTWDTPDEEDDADASEWGVLYVWTPEGQVSWHIPRDLLEQSAITRRIAEWDGHHRKQKNERLRRLSRE